MSDHSAPAPAHAAATPAPENPFTREDLAQFDSDDTTAGKAIGKLLAITFLYTIIAMSIVAWWTFGRS